MSVGNSVIQVRVSPEMESEIAAAIASRNGRTADEPWSLSDFIRVAVNDKLNHYNRSRRQMRGKKYSCSKCGDVVGIKEVAYLVRPLFGPVEITCVMCERIKCCD